MGTALTEDHVRILRRYADRVTLLFDPDAAGAQASLRGGELLVADGFTVDVVTLPDGVDADELLVQSGRVVLDDYLNKAASFMDYFIAAAQKRHPGLAPETKLAMARDVLPVIHKIKDPLLQDEYLGRLANTLRVEKAILGQQMKRLKLTPEDRAAIQRPVSEKKPVGTGLLSIEEEMILLALHYPSESLARILEAVAWEDKRCQEVWQAARTKLSGGTLQVSEVLSVVSEETQEWLTPLVLQQRETPHPAALLDDLVSAWQRQKEGHRWQELKGEIDSMIEGRIPLDAQKVQMYNDLSRRLKGSKPVEHFEGGSTSWLNQRTLQNQKNR